MPTNVKTYDGMGDLEDHLKIFQAAAKIERWAMPTWCHMFNSTFIGSARVWFNKIPSKSIDNYEMLRKAFLGNYSQQNKYIKDPVEIHHIKQRQGEPTKVFMERFKAKSMHEADKEAVKLGQLSHLVKEIKQGGKRGEQAKAAKKGEAPNKEMDIAIFMVQPWQ
ncbi:reverse transcriptase domain-containing protein [Tanacetum coccineum]|uniref:Reverse transcriptase domain-containing protein n=1 Tax=Tanacetum coccineum TaxID=301880 RepID=A0ABQ5J845_9ASTR